MPVVEQQDENGNWVPATPLPYFPGLDFEVYPDLDHAIQEQLDGHVVT